MKIIAVIPARLKSTRFFQKLLFPINNKPLIAHTYENAKKCPILGKIFVATDSEKIAQILQPYNAQIIMTSANCQNGTFRIKEALLKCQDLRSADIIVNLQGDHPLTLPTTVEAVVNMLIDDPTAQIATAATFLDPQNAHLPNLVKCVFDHNRNALYFSRSLIPYSKNGCQYYYHIGIYAYRASFLLNHFPNLKESALEKAEDLEQLKFLENGYKIKVALVNDISIGIDVYEDVKNMEKIVCQIK